MKPVLRVFPLALLCLPLAAQMSVPKIGTARYPDGSFHTVQGLPSNMIVADLPLDNAEAASFSDRGGLIAQNGTIRLLASDFSVIAEYPAGEKPLLSMDGDLTSAFAWLPNAHVLLHWSGSKFDTFPLAASDIDGTVTDIQSSGARQAKLIVEHADRTVAAISISLRNGSLVSFEPLNGVQGYAFGQSFFFVFSSNKELVVDNLRGYRRTVPLGASDFVMERMSNDWLHLYSQSLQQNWALHLTQADVQLSILPGLPEQKTNSTVAAVTHGGSNQ